MRDPFGATSHSTAWHGRAAVQKDAVTNPLILALDHSGLLRHDDRYTLEALCARPRRIEARTDIVREGDPVGDLHIVLDGFVIRYKTLPSGERQIIAVLVPGDFCDLQAVTLGRNDHSIAACTACSIVEVPPRIVDELTLTPSRIARALWWGTLVEESILRQWLTNLGRRQAVQRLAHLMCEVLVRLQAVGRAGPDGCAFPFTLDDLADMLGLTAVHVSRVVRDLPEQELIRLSKRQLEVPNLGQLMAFCDFDPSYLHRRDRSGVAYG